MANESKLGILSGVAVVLLIAVFFNGKPAIGTAFIPNDTASNTPSTTERATTSTPSQPPAGVAAPESNHRSVWQASEPREVKPVSRDPLLWP